MCGCGEVTSVAKKTNTRVGRFAGRHMKFISGHHSRLLRREQCSMWRGGRIVTDEGYIKVRIGDDDCRRYILEHRLVMAEHLGRELLPTENVHHLNGVKDDNRIENLELWSKAQPAGQRVDDKVEFALEILARYAPHHLAALGQPV
jgi:hypothetical protein